MLTAWGWCWCPHHRPALSLGLQLSTPASRRKLWQKEEAQTVPAPPLWPWVDTRVWYMPHAHPQYHWEMTFSQSAATGKRLMSSQTVPSLTGFGGRRESCKGQRKGQAWRGSPGRSRFRVLAAEGTGPPAAVTSGVPGSSLPLRSSLRSPVRPLGSSEALHCLGIRDGAFIGVGPL